MIVKAGMACPIWGTLAPARVDELQITTAPQNGTVTPRGRTGVIYRPDPKFKGEDRFAFAMRGQFAFHNGTSLVRVRVEVQ